MPDLFDSQDFQHRLRAKGFTRRQSRRISEEVAEHLEDLRREGLEAGFPQEAAADYARGKLGDLQALALEMAECLVGRSWAQRWPVASFMVFPLVAFSALFLSAVCAGAVGAAAMRLNLSEWVSLDAIRGVEAILIYSVCTAFFWLARKSGWGSRCKQPRLWPSSCTIHYSKSFSDLQAPGKVARWFGLMRFTSMLSCCWCRLLVSLFSCW